MKSAGCSSKFLKYGMAAVGVLALVGGLTWSLSVAADSESVVDQTTPTLGAVSVGEDSTPVAVAPVVEKSRPIVAAESVQVADTANEAPAVDREAGLAAKLDKLASDKRRLPRSEPRDTKFPLVDASTKPTAATGNDTCPGFSLGVLATAGSDSGLLDAPLANNFAGNAFIAPCVAPCGFYGNTTGPDVIYELEVGVAGMWTFDTCGSLTDTSINLRTGGACPGTTSVACDDDSCTGCVGPTFESTMTASLSTGVIYYLIVDTFTGEVGPYTLNWTPPPLGCGNGMLEMGEECDDGNNMGGDGCSATCQIENNRFCEFAEPVPCDGSVTFDNSAVVNPMNPAYSCRFGNGQAGTLWYSFVATTTSVLVETCGSMAQDSTYAVYDGMCGNLAEIACSEDECGPSGFLGTVCAADLIPGNTYYIQISAWSAADRGEFTVTLDCPCTTIDELATNMLVDMELGGAMFPDSPYTLPRQIISLSSEGNPLMQVQRGAGPFLGPGATPIDTEILSMELSGPSPLGQITIRERTDQPSSGQITNTLVDPMGTLLYGDSYFDVFAEVEVAGNPIIANTNQFPIGMTGQITALPPLGATFTSNAFMDYATTMPTPLPAGITTSIINVPDMGPYKRLVVDLLVDHSSRNGLIITLTHSVGPTTRGIAMSTQAFPNIGNPVTGQSVFFSDDTGLDYPAFNTVPGPSPVGFFNPTQTLAAFNQTNKSGMWTLSITNLGMPGTLVSWSLHFESQDDPAGTTLNIVQCLEKDYIEIPNPPLPIPDNNPAGVTSQIIVPIADESSIQDLNVDVLATHTFRDDLVITLTHLNSGTSVVLAQNPDGSSDNIGDPLTNSPVIFDDEAALAYDPQVGNAVAGNFRPFAPLAAFDTDMKAGTWELSLVDQFNLDIGDLLQWSLHFLNECDKVPVGKIYKVQHFIKSCVPDDAFTFACSNPVPLKIMGNTLNSDDSCNASTFGGDDFGLDDIYEITITETGKYNFNMCTQSPGGGDGWDSVMYLTSTCCTNPILAQDDDGCGILAGNSRLLGVHLDPGVYYLTVDGFGPLFNPADPDEGLCDDDFTTPCSVSMQDCASMARCFNSAGPYTVTVDCCEVECPMGGVPENEPDCRPGYNSVGDPDLTNFGCSTTTLANQLFTPLPCDTTVCAETGVFDTATCTVPGAACGGTALGTCSPNAASPTGFSCQRPCQTAANCAVAGTACISGFCNNAALLSRDNDWYEVTLSPPGQLVTDVTITVEAENVLNVALFERVNAPPNNCLGTVLLQSFNTVPCLPNPITRTLVCGTYYLRVRPNALDRSIRCGQPYNISATCSPSLGTGACCLGQMGCQQLDECTCEVLMGGTYLGNGVACPIDDCDMDGEPDACCIASGFSLTGPNACDCNRNMIPDDCDITGGTSEDCQPNGIPDECDVDTFVKMTQSNSNIITTQVACAGAVTTGNWWGRCFAVPNARQIDAVMFGVLTANQTYMAQINVWSENDNTCPPGLLTGATLLGTTNLTITPADAGRLKLAQFAVPVVIPAGSAIIVEAGNPCDGTAAAPCPGLDTRIAGNGDGSIGGAASFIRSTGCGLVTSWNSHAAIGFGTIHNVISAHARIVNANDADADGIPNACEGACCTGAVCVVTDEDACVLAMGMYRGDGTTCTPNPCSGSCCRDAACSIETPADCAIGGGIYGGDGTMCSATTCGGGCCRMGVCTVEQQLACETTGGVYQGDGVGCAINPCPGACCQGQLCVEVSEAVCAILPGTFEGAGTVCTPTTCGCMSDADCDDDTLCTINYCENQQCFSKPVRYADVNNDNFVNTDDTLCILETFAGNIPSAGCGDRDLPGIACLMDSDCGPLEVCVMNVCLPEVNCQKKDIAGNGGACPVDGSPGGSGCLSADENPLDGLLDHFGEGFINADDLGAILSTFAGDLLAPTAACVTACPGPSPAAAADAAQDVWFGVTREMAVAAPTATITFVPAKRVIRAGETVSVDVYVTGAANLRAYQVGLEALALRSGSLTLEDIDVDVTREDLAFAPTFYADSLERHAMMNVLGTSYVDASERTYLGTFTFRASADARGLFRFVANPAETLLRDGGSRPVTVGALDAAVIVTNVSVRASR